MSRRAVLAVVCVFAVAACEGANPAVDALAPRPDAARVDAAPDGSLDAALFPLSGFGTLSGDCDALDSELTSASPSLFRSAIDFAVGYTEAHLEQLTPGGREIIADDNAGGSSLYSEVFAYELLQRCELATLLKTETEIQYQGPGKITDLLVEVDGVKLGVSVTRAVAFPFDAPYTVTQARDLLQGKLDDILLSSANVAAADRWQKQILAVLAYAPGHADALTTAVAELPAATTADTIVWILVTNGDDAFIYCDGSCR